MCDEHEYCECKNLIIYDFNLVLPEEAILYKMLEQFNAMRREREEPEYLPDIERDNYDTILCTYNNGGYRETYLAGESVCPPYDPSFYFYTDFFDYSDGGTLYEFVEFLCEKFGGTFVGVYISTYLYPVKIINGNRIPCRLALVDDITILEEPTSAEDDYDDEV